MSSQKSLKAASRILGQWQSQDPVLAGLALEVVAEEGTPSGGHSDPLLLTAASEGGHRNTQGPRPPEQAPRV